MPTSIGPVAMGFHRTKGTTKTIIALGGDSAFPYPGGEYPADITVGAFYIGGDTPHTWTVSEINRMAQGVDFLLPIYVTSNPAQRNAVQDAAQANARLAQIGAPRCRVALDLEVAVDPEYVQIFRDNIAHRLVTYGSVGSILSNNWPYNWVADPGATTTGLFGPVKGRQFMWEKFVDFTWWDADFVARSFWFCGRKRLTSLLDQS